MNTLEARAWAKESAKASAVSLAVSVAGLAITQLVSSSDNLWQVVVRGIGFIMFFGGSGFCWVFGTIAVATYLYSRQRP